MLPKTLNMNPYVECRDSSYYLYLHETPIRVYSFHTIRDINHLHLDTSMATQSLRHFCSLAYPYMWCVYRHKAVIVHKTDLDNYEPTLSTANLMNQQIILTKTRYMIIPYGHPETTDDDVVNFLY